MDTTPAHSSQRECWVWFAEEPVLPLGYELLSFKEAVFRVSDSVFHPCRFETLLSALDVPEDLLWQKLSNGKRRDIRIARNRHWRVCSGQSPDDIERFHRLHSLFTETKGLAAPLPLTILQRNSRSCWGSFVHVGDGQVLCWHFYVLDKPLVRLWYSGSNLACSSKADRGYAAALLHWEMMRHFREQGFRTYDWGGASTDPLSPTRSITRFKMDFGGVPAERFDYVCRVRLPYCARAWRHIRGRLAAFRGRLRHALFRSIPSTLCRRIAGVFGHAKPRILLLADKRHWAHDHSARQIVRWLQHDYAFDVRYVRESPKLDPAKYDLVYVFWWGETYHQSFGFDPARVIKGLSSHRWEDDPRFGPCSPVEMVHRYLRGTGAVLCPSLRLFNLLSPVYPRSYHVPKGYDSRLFRLSHRRSGPMTIGWAGNAKDPVKRCQELLLPACGDRFRLVMAGGDLSHRRMSRFYRDVDVFAVTSRHEGDPLTLIEAMAAGCFPVCTDVGIVPELVRSGENGLIVEGTAAGFREAFEWCETHLTEVRAAGERNAMEMKNHRRWELAAQAYGRVFSEILRKLQQPRFRNDDVSWDTDLARFRTFCSVFQKYGHQQVHGITLFGRTSTVFRHGSDPVAYENTPSISALANDRIRELSQNCRFAERRDLVQFLRDSPDEIALHGLFHTDYSTMTYEEQCRDIREGLRLLDELFPRKPVRYFVAPFNRANAATVRACAELDLFVLANEGVHLEAELADLRLRPGVWYRYHHHRFYPETAFSYYRLSLDALDSTLGRHGHAVNRLM